jgi:hypothetical protein
MGEQRHLAAAATVLDLSDRALATAAAYASTAAAEEDEDEADRCAACLFLAAKMCEEPRRVRDVLNAVHLARAHELLRDSHAYWARKERLVLAEQRLLRALGFDTSCIDPQVLLLNVLRACSCSLALCELSVAVLNDGTHALAALPPRLRVAAALQVGASALGLALPTHWQQLLGVDGEPHALAAACHALLDSYDPRRGTSELSIVTTRTATPRAAESAPAAPGCPS